MYEARNLRSQARTLCVRSDPSSPGQGRVTQTGARDSMRRGLPSSRRRPSSPHRRTRRRYVCGPCRSNAALHRGSHVLDAAQIDIANHRGLRGGRRSARDEQTVFSRIAIRSRPSWSRMTIVRSNGRGAPGTQTRSAAAPSGRPCGGAFQPPGAWTPLRACTWSGGIAALVGGGSCARDDDGDDGSRTLPRRRPLGFAGGASTVSTLGRCRSLVRLLERRPWVPRESPRYCARRVALVSRSLRRRTLERFGDALVPSPP